MANLRHDQWRLAGGCPSGQTAAVGSCPPPTRGRTSRSSGGGRECRGRPARRRSVADGSLSVALPRRARLHELRRGPPGAAARVGDVGRRGRRDRLGLPDRLRVFARRLQPPLGPARCAAGLPLVEPRRSSHGPRVRAPRGRPGLGRVPVRPDRAIDRWQLHAGADLDRGALPGGHPGSGDRILPCRDLDRLRELPVPHRRRPVTVRMARGPAGGLARPRAGRGRGAVDRVGHADADPSPPCRPGVRVGVPAQSGRPSPDRRVHVPLVGAARHVGLDAGLPVGRAHAAGAGSRAGDGRRGPAERALPPHGVHRVLHRRPPLGPVRPDRT